MVEGEDDASSGPERNGRHLSGDWTSLGDVWSSKLNDVMLMTEPCTIGKS